MISNGIEIVVGATNRSYRLIGPIKARVGAITVFSPEPSFDEVNRKLQGIALHMGATAVINVTYKRGVSMTSWKALTVKGLAVVFDS